MNFSKQALAIMQKHGFTVVEQSKDKFVLYRDGKPTPIVENSSNAIIYGCMQTKLKLGQELRQLNEKDLQGGFSWNAQTMINV